MDRPMPAAIVMNMIIWLEVSFTIRKEYWVVGEMQAKQLSMMHLPFVNKQI